MKFHMHNKTLTFANAPAGIRLLNYIKAVRFIIDAASSAIKTTGKKNEGKFNILGWNSVVKTPNCKTPNCRGSLPVMGKLQ